MIRQIIIWVLQSFGSAFSVQSFHHNSSPNGWAQIAGFPCKSAYGALLQEVSFGYPAEIRFSQQEHC